MKRAMVDLRTSNGRDCNTSPLRTSRNRCSCIFVDTSPSNSTANMGWNSAAFEPRPPEERTPCTMKF